MNTDRPTYAYSFSEENPSLCMLLVSTHEIDAWNCIGTIDRRFAQLIVTALNYSSTQ